MFPILIKVGGVALHAYGLLVALGVVAAASYARRRVLRLGVADDDFWGLAYWVLGGAFVGGKLLYVAVSGEWSLRYGFVFYGGLIGALGAGAVYLRRRGWRFLEFADAVIPALPLGHALGRLGCFAAGCCHGKATEAPWGVAFTHPESLVPTGLLGTPLHPVQLYEAAGNLAIFALLHWAVVPRRLGGRASEGGAFWTYVAAYAALRFALEFARGDDRGPGLGPLSVSQAIALAGLLAALVLRRGPRTREAA
jgi:phosphatidylglycerol:prolipoprotein diacylglycerol transferase